MTAQQQLIFQDSSVLQDFMLSALLDDSPLTPTADFAAWFASRADAHPFQVSRVPFAELTGWRFDPTTGNLGHESGRFFTIGGLDVRTDRTWISHWRQPIIVQPEIGVLGILAKKFDGILHFLMQAKMEPGNVNTVQLSPTVQATRSNYMGVHKGAEIRYLEHFAPGRHSRVLVDALQSEQGAWFLHKRNRNMVVETDEDVMVEKDFCWLTLGQIRGLLRIEHLVNMDARTVLSCIPVAVSAGSHSAQGKSAASGEFPLSVLRSAQGEGGARHSISEVLSWLTELRARRELIAERIPLTEVRHGGWQRSATAISHESGRYFEVVAVDVQAGSREIASWRQPLVAPRETGLLALIARTVDGTLHILVQARADAGSLNGAEIAPTVHCQPANYRDVPPEHRPHFLDYVEEAEPHTIRYDVMQSEEGGRFLHAVNRYLVIEAGEDFPLDVPEEYCWVTVYQLTSLLAHSNYLNVELRSLLACTQSIW
ncbi:NDP-hexose 2,3-dehydratase family protein [Saccharomonospora xinjiangensis]|uniref:NDP-hexose 2,3-dehydratase n=1 Tax=Saccharomonospora xinjiangensis XJ-54 TaxID=882086 RepID=I0UWW1_9PSEU|nr:NDP-hexose 2,3-dehydratase family protein [Saccharomonospora xinjiangensis]EID52364.1 NDP-hexose 2,3-dehydratase [Saccharomonospora xinjiangensis XJ-54]